MWSCMSSHIPIDRYVCTAVDQLKKSFFCFSKMSFLSPSHETLNMLPKVQNDEKCSRTPCNTASNILSINIYMLHIH